MAKSKYRVVGTDFGSLADLDTHFGDESVVGKKTARLIDDAVGGTVSGKGSTKAIEAAEDMFSITKGGGGRRVIEGRVVSTEIGAGKSWWGRLKGQMFGEDFSTKKLQKLYGKLEDLKQQQAMGIGGLEGKLEETSRLFEEEARRVIPHLPHTQEAANRALAAVEQQQAKSTRAAHKAIDKWHDLEKETKLKDLRKGLAATEKSAGLTAGVDGKYWKWDAATLDHVKDTDALKKDAAAVFKKDHKKDLHKLVTEKKKDIAEEIAKSYKAQKKPFKQAAKLSQQMIEGVEQQTGMKATEFVSTKGREALAATGHVGAIASLKADKNILGGSITGNLKKGLWSKGKVAVGAVGVFDGLRRTWEGFSPGQDEQGNPKAMDPFKIAVGAGETVLGAFVAGHGGHIRR
jgi:hypothetical protein